MKKIIFLLFLASCTKENLNTSYIDFDKDFSFTEFQIFLENYNNVNDYPDIDK